MQKINESRMFQTKVVKKMITKLNNEMNNWTQKGIKHCNGLNKYI